MSKIVQTHGKYHDMFPMMFHCELCECVFKCESISDVSIYAFCDEIFADTNCPECEAIIRNSLGSIIEVNNND